MSNPDVRCGNYALPGTGSLDAAVACVGGLMLSGGVEDVPDDDAADIDGDGLREEDEEELKQQADGASSGSSIKIRRSSKQLGFGHVTDTHIGRRLQGMRERKEEHRRMLQARLPPLSELQVKRQKYTYKHFLFFDLLQDGFHKTHSEIYFLLRYQRQQREEAGKRSPLWTKKTLEEQEDKMCTMARRLMQAESAVRIEDFQLAYEQHYSLAIYFKEMGEDDKWLSDHFYFNCMSVASKIKDDEGELLAHACVNMGSVYESLGYLEDAIEQYQHCYELTEDDVPWFMRDSDVPLHNEACISLHRVYTKLAVKALMEDDDRDASVNYYLKAYNAAREGGGRKLFGEACLQLALAYERNRDPDTALLHLHNLMDNYCVANDKESIPSVLEAMGIAYQSQGRLECSIKYFNEFVKSTEEMNDRDGFIRGCKSVAYLYNLVGHFNTAMSYLRRAMNTPVDLVTCAQIATNTETRVMYGIGLAHVMGQRVNPHINTANGVCIERILDWKDTRTDTFTKELPTEVPDQPRETRRRNQYRKDHFEELELDRRQKERRASRLSRRSSRTASEFHKSGRRSSQGQTGVSDDVMMASTSAVITTMASSTSKAKSPRQSLK